MTSRRQFIASTFSAGLGLTPLRLAAQSGGPVKIVFPFSPGGGGDTLSRLLAERIGPALGRAVIVENRTGADGRLGIQAVKAAAPDGDTLLITTGPTMWLMALVHKAPGYDPFQDFEPVAQVAEFEFCIAVASNTGITSMPALAVWAKANPDKATYGVPGLGTIPHFIGVALSKLIGVEMQRLPYRGGVPAIRDLTGGQVPIVIGTLTDALQQHRAGTLRIIGVVGDTRSPFAADVPTLKEAGYDLQGSSWYGMWAPAGTPRAVIRRINGAVLDALREPDVKQRFDQLGLILSGTSPEQLTQIMRETSARWAPVIKASGYSIEQ